MYAIIKLNGAQVKVEKNDKFTVNRLKEQKSKAIKVDKVLFGKKGSSYHIGDPYVKGAFVECEILGDKRAKKVIAFKYRDRKSSQSKIGHRQDLTELVVKDIYFEGGKEKVEKKETNKTEKKTVKAAEKKPVEKKTIAKKPAEKKTTAKAAPKKTK